MTPSDAASRPAAVVTGAPDTPLVIDADRPICLDFLKSRCRRDQCRFLHPDLAQYRQLSKAVHAQAGRRVCEVWAMTGQCKFGAKCSRLHPSVMLNPQTQSGVTLLLPLLVAPPATALPPPPPPAAALAFPPTAVFISVGTPLVTVGPPRPPSSSAAPSNPRPTTVWIPTPPSHPKPPLAISPAPAVFPLPPTPGAFAAGPDRQPARPRHVAPPQAAAPPPADLPQPAPPALGGRRASDGCPTPFPAANQWTIQATAAEERRQFLACLFGTDGRRADQAAGVAVAPLHHCAAAPPPLLALPWPLLDLLWDSPEQPAHPPPTDCESPTAPYAIHNISGLDC